MSHPHSKLTTEQRFLLYVTKTADCWLWTGGKNQKGYALFWNSGDGRRESAHRVAYRMWVGEIPAGLELDHLCRTRHCVNPAHLEAVTHRENVLRAPDHVGKREAAKTHCPHNHPLDGKRFDRRKNAMRRYCMTCERTRHLVVVA